VTNDLTVVLPPLHPGQREVWDSRARYRVLACGRRWGKTRLGTLLCHYAGLTGRRAWWVAPSYTLTRVGWRGIVSLAQQGPANIWRGVHRVEYPSGGSVEVRSADNPDSLRSEGLDLVVVDECAYVSEEAWTHALRPALADKRGDAVFISTPRGRDWFWRLIQRGVEGEDGWRSWHFPSSANPYLHPSEIETARREMPERVFRQEFLAEFLESGGEVFRTAREAAVASPSAPVEGHRYWIGVDLARKSDWTAVSVVDVTEEPYHEVSLERYNAVLWEQQVGRIRATVERYRPERLFVDQTGLGDVVAEQLRAALPGVRLTGVTFSAPVRCHLLDNLALLFETRRLTVLPDPVALGELEAFQVRDLPGGGVRYEVPEPGHDDTVFARALAVWGFASRVPSVEWA